MPDTNAVHTPRSLVPAGACALLVLLQACSDPAPGLSAEAFYARAAATRERVLGAAPNAWGSLADALAMHDGIVSDESLRADPNPDHWPSMQLDAIRFGPFPRPGLEGGLALLERLDDAGCFGTLDAALDAPGLAAPWDTTRPVYTAYSAGFGHAGQARGLGRTLYARLRVAAVEGDAPEVVRTFENQLALARAVANRCLAADYVMGVAGVTMSLQEARHLAVEEALTPDMIRGMLAAMDRTPLLPPPDAVIDAERDFSLATFVDSAEAQGIAINRRLWLARIEAAHAAAASNLANADRGPTAAMSGDEFFGAVLQGAADQDQLLALLDQTFAMVVDNDRRLALDLAGTRAVLLVALHRAEHGAYPASLEAAGAPRDPVAGGPFVLRVGEPGSGVPFLLYSIGADGVDNGGVELDGGFLEPPGPDDEGYDYVLTRARPPYVGFEDVGGPAGPGLP